ATTGDHNSAEQMERLCALHRALGVPDEDHVVRPIVRRGRAASRGMGVVAEAKDLHPELTLTAAGAFWSPFAPPGQAGRLDGEPLTFERPPARRRARTGTSSMRRPARAALTTISSGQPYVAERMSSAISCSRRIARMGPRSDSGARQAARMSAASARLAAIWC